MPAQAHIEGYNLSLMAGPGFENRTGHTNVFIPGLTLAYVFPERLEVGVEFLMTGTVPTVGLDVNYFVIPFLFFGVQAGAEIGPLQVDPHRSPAFGPYMGFQGGYDYMISHNLAVGPEIQYLFDLDEGGGLLETLAVVKYFF